MRIYTVHYLGYRCGGCTKRAARGRAPAYGLARWDLSAITMAARYRARHPPQTARNVRGSDAVESAQRKRCMLPAAAAKNGVAERHMAQEDDRDPPPGVQRWLISCDESGVHGARFYGFGTLWMAWQRRGDFQALMREIRERHRYRPEIKWNDISNGVVPFYSALIETFFTTPWLAFHCLAVEKASVKKELHEGDMDLARRKHFTALLVTRFAAPEESIPSANRHSAFGWIRLHRGTRRRMRPSTRSPTTS
jgi:hypothetical protein